jgi:HEAT repeat protein
LIHALAARRVAAAVDPLLALATDPAPSVRRAAIAALGALADRRHLAALATLAATVQPGEDAEALIEAAGRAFARADDPAKCADLVLAQMDRAPAASRPTLVRLLGKTGAEKALEALRGFVDDGTPEVREAAVQALIEWPDASAGADLLALLTDPAHADRKQAVLAGYLRLAALSDDPGAMYLAALAHVEEVAGKKAVLEGLGLTADSPQALDVALRCLDDPALEAAAGVAALRIAFQLRRADESRARQAVEQVLAKVDHPDVGKRGREVLAEFDKYDDHILQWVTLGPFQERGRDGAAIYRTVFPPETDPDAADWQPLTKGIGSWNVNLEATYGGLDFVAAYLRTRVWSEVEQEVQLEMGSDDGVKAWLNGELLYDQWGEGSISPREKRVKARLRKGWNDLMLKVVDQQGGWMGACRIRKPDGSALSGLKVEAR